MRPNVAVIGAGSWGTTLASHVCATRADHDLGARGRTSSRRSTQRHANSLYLEGFELPTALAGDPVDGGSDRAGRGRRDGRAVALLPGGPRAGRALRPALGARRERREGLRAGDAPADDRGDRPGPPRQPARGAVRAEPGTRDHGRLCRRAPSWHAATRTSRSACRASFNRGLYRVYTTHDVVGVEAGGGAEERDRDRGRHGRRRGGGRQHPRSRHHPRPRGAHPTRGRHGWRGADVCGARWSRGPPRHVHQPAQPKSPRRRAARQGPQARRHRRRDAHGGRRRSHLSTGPGARETPRRRDADRAGDRSRRARRGRPPWRPTGASSAARRAPKPIDGRRPSGQPDEDRHRRSDPLRELRDHARERLGSAAAGRPDARAGPAGERNGPPIPAARPGEAWRGARAPAPAPARSLLSPLRDLPAVPQEPSMPRIRSVLWIGDPPRLRGQRDRRLAAPRPRLGARRGRGARPAPRRLRRRGARRAGPGERSLEASRRLLARRALPPLVARLAEPDPRAARALLDVGVRDVWPTSEAAARSRRARIARRGRRARRPAAPSARGHPDIVGESPAMREVFALLERAQRTSATVLLTGETGTGKELLAREIHRGSERRRARLRRGQLRGLPRDAARERALRPRARRFTGADRDKQGLFEVADGGTLFLDEIGETSGALPGEAAARAPGARDPPGRRHAPAQGGRAPRRRHEPRPARRGAQRPLPRGPLLPPRRLPDRGAAAARADRGRPAPRRALPRRSTAPARASPAAASPATPPACCSPTPGPATCASSRTRCSAPSPSPSPASSSSASCSRRACSACSSPSRPTSSEGETLRESLGRVEAWLIRRTLERCDGRRAETARRLGITREGLYKKMKRFGIR